MFEELKQNKLLKYLTIAALVIALGVLAKEFVFSGKELEVSKPKVSFPQVKMNFDFLKQDKTKQLQEFEGVSLPEKTGKDNPFKSF